MSSPMLFRLRVLLLAAATSWAPLASAQSPGGDETVLRARDALAKKDTAALAKARAAVLQTRHPLAMWVDYWELGNRLATAQQPELEAFYARWPGTYVEDRLRNDWLLELGRRQDWANFRTEHPRFRMNDDRVVTCYALLTRHLDGQDVREPARAAWLAQRDADDGCSLMARTLFEAGRFTEDDVWLELRMSVENNRLRAARDAAALLGKAAEARVFEALDEPQRTLARSNAGHGAHGHDLLLLAVMRLAAADPDRAAELLQSPTAHRLPVAMEATAWAHLARHAALSHRPGAAEHARHAWRLWDRNHPPGTQPGWSEELLAWHVRAALREPAREPRRWPLIARAIEAMPPAEQARPSWVYWKARAQQAQARPGAEGDAARAAAHAALAGIAQPFDFYGLLAAEELGQPFKLPAAATAPSPAEREAVRGQPGLARALQLIALGLRSEGVREWNFTLRGLQERELLAAAQWACERAVWDRCINTSDRSRTEIDAGQRYPLAFREQIMTTAQATGLDAAVLFGLIRQESRFITDARSAVGASGLMQLMPATARWTAKKVGLDFKPGMVNDPQVNLQLGAAYLKRVLDDFGGSLAMATAAYNAGPGRPRRWREGGVVMEPAAWAESIPFNETRDYVQKVLTNSVAYAALLGATAPTLKERLGAPIGPRTPNATTPDRDLP
ncbi:MAG: lytic transglycosylase domain-containing protein [Betaproteobacteria bacterium]|nr:lytic transglycosylase domain-containing protein [Betaproteobacteria bacterium]